jgi:hypothetical protein
MAFFSLVFVLLVSCGGRGESEMYFESLAQFGFVF